MNNFKVEYEHSAEALIKLVMTLVRLEMLTDKDMVRDIDTFTPSRYVGKHGKAFKVAQADSKATELLGMPDDSI